MKRIKRVLYGFRHEGLADKVRYMLSLSLAERYAQTLDFAEFMLLAAKERKYKDVRKAFGSVQIIKKK